MRRLKTIVAALFLSSAFIYAQAAGRSDDFKGYWNMFVRGGAAHTVGEADFGELLSPTASIGFGYRLTPVWGLRADFNGWQGKGATVSPKTLYSFNFIQANIDATVDICSIFAGFRSARLLNPYILVGVGANGRFGNDGAVGIKDRLTPGYVWDGTKFSPTGRAGVGLDIRLSDLIDLNLEVNSNILTDKFNSKVGSAVDFQHNALIGVKFNFGKPKAKDASSAAGAAGSAAAAAAAALAVSDGTVADSTTVALDSAAVSKDSTTVALDSTAVGKDSVPATTSQIANGKDSAANSKDSSSDAAVSVGMAKTGTVKTGMAKTGTAAGKTSAGAGIDSKSGMAGNNGTNPEEQAVSSGKGDSEQVSGGKGSVGKDDNKNNGEDAVKSGNPVDVLFRIGKWDISEAEALKIRNIAKCMKKNPNTTVTVTGYADKETGSAERNMLVSEQRAKAVKDMLVASGVDGNRIKTDFKGSTVAPYATPSRNRVAICVIK